MLLCGVLDLSGISPVLVFGGEEGGGKAEDPKLPVEEEEIDEDLRL